MENTIVSQTMPYRIRFRSGIYFCIGSVVWTCFLWGCSGRKVPEGMVVIPAGPFIMGSNKVDTEGLGAEIGLIRPLYEDEHPERILTLPKFYIDVYEVTQSQYFDFARRTGRAPPPVWENGVYPSGRERHPVAFVSWYDARQFCQWAGKRLPTEAEWEKAARGPNGMEYPWGDVFEEGRGNTADSGTNDTLPVGGFESGQSPYGVFDMTGNIGEWVDSGYKPYPGNLQRSLLFGERFKVIRGGSWGGSGGHYAMSIFYRAAHRLFGDPLDRFPDTGFRCAQS